VAASLHGDTPYSGNSVTPLPVTPYTTSVDVNPKPNALTSGYAPQDTSVAAAVRYTSVRPGFQKATDRRTPGHGRPGWERLR
jgi:hypothetical protein